MSKIPPPPRKSRLPSLAFTQGIEPSNNLTAARQTRVVQDLNFKVSPEEHQDFKAEAVLRGMSMTDLLRASLAAFREINGRRAPELPAQKTINQG